MSAEPTTSRRSAAPRPREGLVELVLTGNSLEMCPRPESAPPEWIRDRHASRPKPTANQQHDVDWPLRRLGRPRDGERIELRKAQWGDGLRLPHRGLATPQESNTLRRTTSNRIHNHRPVATTEADTGFEDDEQNSSRPRVDGGGTLSTKGWELHLATSSLWRRLDCGVRESWEADGPVRMSVCLGRWRRPGRTVVGPTRESCSNTKGRPTDLVRRPSPHPATPTAPRSTDPATAPADASPTRPSRCPPRAPRPRRGSADRPSRAAPPSS